MTYLTDMIVVAEEVSCNHRWQQRKTEAAMQLSGLVPPDGCFIRFDDNCGGSLYRMDQSYKETVENLKPLWHFIENPSVMGSAPGW